MGAALAPAWPAGASTALLLQLNAVSPAAPVQTQPVPVGVPASTMPGSERSRTV
ncbi:MAG: hypothetical protein QE285_12685 [Aquabacterium sp.]|nr:hypothetical protein [Aquabacterium sp.]